jgi:hypothetical protein
MCPGSDVCLYRGPNGEKCAVGLLIPDEEYGAWMDSSIEWHVGALLDAYERCPASLRALAGHSSLLKALQWAHDKMAAEDDSYPTHIDPARLRKVADDFSLTIPEVSP